MMNIHAVFWLAYIVGIATGLLTALLSDRGVSTWKLTLIGTAIVVVVNMLLFGLSS